MPFPYAEINKERFPLVFISFTGEPSTDENFLDYLNGMKDLYSRKKDLSIIFDARKATLPSLRHQKMQAKRQPTCQNTRLKECGRMIACQNDGFVFGNSIDVC